MRIGCDIVSIARFKTLVNYKQFKKRLFSEEEYEYCSQASHPELTLARLAARFAAKEACSKALGIGIGKQFSFLDLAILDQKSLQPYKISDRLSLLLKNMNLCTIHVSLSHEKHYAMAVVLLS